eukprot:9024293-Prorocentrum_lima.AAC.1
MGAVVSKDDMLKRSLLDNLTETMVEKSNTYGRQCIICQNHGGRGQGNNRRRQSSQGIDGMQVQ